jgi:queuine tRNA-ribosyltransferase
VKSLDPDEVRGLGASILLGNTYHLHFRPGDELIAELGGLHAFMGWDGPILTDSGGFQVFSLRDTLQRVDDDGVTFRSVYDGGAARFTPESVARIQANLGSDVAMCLDVCAPAGVPEPELAEAVRLTTEWATRQRAAERAPGQLVFGIAQGAAHPELRRRSIEEIVALGFDGYALGGLAVGESRETMFDAVGAATPRRPGALLHGHRRPGGDPPRHRRRDRHVRLRAADAHRAHRLGADLGGPAEPEERAVRARPAAA